MFGELIAGKVFDNLVSSGTAEENLRLPFTKTVSNACLLHDIGNPPFGHLGEYAIQKWIADNEQSLCSSWKKQGVAQEHVARFLPGFKYFDGNAQGFRIVSRLQWLSDSSGLNLTASLLASMVKYLTPTPATTKNRLGFRGKVGYFESESKTLEQIWKRLGLKWDANAGLPGQRHPLVFLMEAADDIAYCLSDIEDALEKRIVSEEAFKKALDRTTRRKHWKKLDSKKRHCKYAEFVVFRTNLTRHLVNRAAEIFCEQHDAILDGELQHPLLDLDKESSAALDGLKQFARKNIFVSAEAVGVELSGFQIVTGLLDALSPLLSLASMDFRALLERKRSGKKPSEFALESRLVELLSRKHALAFLDCVDAEPDLEPIFRLQLLLDYVSGMTDSHAVKTYHVVRGFPSVR